MSIISLLIAPLIKGNQDWQGWYYGVAPLVIMLVSTFLAYHFFWKDQMGVTPAPQSAKKQENGSSLAKENHREDPKKQN